MDHLHFGAGALGLGLTCYISSSLNGNDVYLCNRFDEKSSHRNDLLKTQKRYTVVVPDLNERDLLSSVDSVEVTLKDFLYLGTDDDSIARVSDTMRPLIITTALKEYGLRGISETIIAILQKRSELGYPTFFISCENAVSSTEFANDYNIRHLKGVFFLDSVVDRICNKPRVEKGKVGLACEKYTNWIIQEPNDEFCRNLLKSELSPENGGVEFTTDIQKYVMRKKWMVNSAHLSCAMVAHFRDHSELHRFLTLDSYGVEALAGICEETRLLFLSWNEDNGYPFTVDEIKRYSTDVQQRLRSHPQSVTSCTTRFKPELLIEFFKDFDRKVTEPLITYGYDQGMEPLWLSLVSVQINALISDEAWI